MLVCVRSVHSRSPWGSSGSFVFVRYIPVRPGGRRVHSGAFGPFLCALGVAGCVRLGGHRVHSGAYVRIPCALRVVGLGRVLSAHHRGTWGAFGCFRPIPLRTGCDRVRSIHSPSSASFCCVRSIPARPAGFSFGAFPFALGVVVFVRVRSVDSRAPLGS